MFVLIRADATPEIGTGHLMRCAALAMRLMGRGAEIHFICGPLHQGLQDWLRNHKFGFSVLNKEDVDGWKSDLAATLDIVNKLCPRRVVDLLIVDNYQLEFNWELGIREYVNRIFVIDDLANRKHCCDLLLDQNLRANMKERYKNLLPINATQFLGPQYALLRSEFDFPGLVRERDGTVKNLLIFFGGTDPGGQLTKAIAAVSRLGKLAPETTVLLGHAHPCPDKIYTIAFGIQKLTILEASDQISQLMAKADLAIGTCGIAAWERCFLGLPSMVVITADNQRQDAEILHNRGAVINLGDADLVTSDDWYRELKLAMSNPKKIHSMAISSQKIMSLRESAQLELEQALIDEII